MSDNAGRPACRFDAATDSRLADEPGPWVVIVDCSVHGEIARVPAGGTYRDEGQRVTDAWNAHAVAWGGELR